MVLIEEGIAKAVLEKYAEPIVKGIAKLSKNEWEKFKIDFDVTFFRYLKKSYEKYSKIKTILCRTEPKYIYDFFECPSISKGTTIVFEPLNVNSILEVSNFVIIQGTGGIGKSILMKHLFISELSNKDLIPIFIELKDLNGINDEYTISKLIFEKLINLGSTLKEEYLGYALESGCFLFLFDGYDEIITDKKDEFYKKLDEFCDKYTKNYFIISSRPYSEFVEFQRFTVLSTKCLNKKQALSLIEKIDFDYEVKQRFIKALDIDLFEKHKSFASNPLLLNIMLLTFDNFADIPEKLHLFYSNAFETLYSKHDATKSGYKREMRSKLSYDSFRKVFSCFSFISYSQGKIEFTYDELIELLKKTSISRVAFNIEDYIYDLVNSLCVIYKDGLEYKFAHRSFQEYFTAVFLKELPDENLNRLGIQLIKKDIFRLVHDDVYYLLFDMAEPRFEKNILKYLVDEFENDYEECSDKYEYCFKSLNVNISYRGSIDENERLYLSRDSEEGFIGGFIFDFSRFYIERSDDRNDRINKASDILKNYLIFEKNYVIGKRISYEEIINDSKIYNLIKETWIGEAISIMASLKEILEKKQEKMEIDLSNLIV